MKLTLRIWRQTSAAQPGHYESHQLDNVSPDLSLLEALDQLNEQLIGAGERPVSFDHDCREGICGSCGFLVNGQAHGPRAATSVCQLYLREFSDGDALTLEPWRAKAFPLVQDLMVDRSSFDRLIAAGGYCSTGTGQAPDGNALPVGRDQATQSLQHRHLHRLRRLCRQLPQRLSQPVRRRQAGPPGAASPGAAGTGQPCPGPAGADERGRIRQLQQQPRMRGGLPPGDLRRLDQLDAR